MRREIEIHLAENIASLALRIEHDISKCANRKQVLKINADLDKIISWAEQVKEGLRKL